MSLRTPLGRARGLGSARDGVHHWWAERLAAIALAPLVVWFTASVVALTGADHVTVAAWIASPPAAIMLLLMIALAFRHGHLGLQVVIEDYVQNPWMRTALLIGNVFVAGALAAICAYSVVSLTFA